MGKHAIILAGDLGAGKTSVAKNIVSVLGLKLMVTGQFFKDEAVKRGISFDQLHEDMKTDSSIDLAIDEMQKKFLADNTDYIIDSRLGKYFEPNAFGVYLKVDPDEGAKRIFNDIKDNPKRLSESGAKNPAHMKELNAKRLESEKIRYQALYGIDHTDLRRYDLVIDTTTMSSKAVANIVIKAFSAWCASNVLPENQIAR